ncbi:ligand-gated channel [Nitrobacter sp. TKz-YC01]
MDITWGNMRNPVYGTALFTAPSYWVVDLMARYKFTDNLSATLNVGNLFDRRYINLADFYGSYTWGAPRNVFLSMTYRF